MTPTLSAGLLLGVLCGLWTFVMGFTGWYKDPDKTAAFFLVIVIEVAVLLWGLVQTAKEGRTYSGQVVAGTLMSIIGGVVIIGFSLLFTTVFFPDYFTELETASRAILQKEGKSEAEIAAILAEYRKGQSPLIQAFSGFAGTFVTGVVVSAVLAIWVRARPTSHVARST